MPQPKIYTIGHSSRSIEDFIALLKAHGVEVVLDVRSIPKSLHNPQFEQDTLKASLKGVKIGYRHLPELGGLRHARKDSVNTGWRNASFRGYADYMQTEEFWKGVEKLEKIASNKTCAIMCAEAVPWRCHRSLIADTLGYLNLTVLHILNLKTVKRHKRTPFLKIRNGRFVYV